jgi:serine/threonine protein kinase
MARSYPDVIEAELMTDRTIVERHDPLLGTVLDGRFRIDFRIAAGGFGAIYRATHVRSGHEVALKILHPTLTPDPKIVARFRREGETLTSLRSPHTITAYEACEAADGTLYIVMELLDGESLHERLGARGAMPWQAAVAIARGVCNSLAEAHALVIIHRDLKPANIHLERRGDDDLFVKVLDFGIAKIEAGSEFDNSDLTHAGQMIGTLDYMAPEQMVGGEVSGRTDVYTLGVVIYEMIAGVRPFPEARSASAALAAMLTTTPPALSTHARIPAELERIVMRCLQRDARHRSDVAELTSDLDHLVEDDPPTTMVAMPASAPVADATWIAVPPPPTRPPSHPAAPIRPPTDPPISAVSFQRFGQGTGPVYAGNPPANEPRSSVEIAPFDMSSAAARDAVVRRLLWAVLLVIAVVILIALAS